MKLFKFDTFFVVLFSFWLNFNINVFYLYAMTGAGIEQIQNKKITEKNSKHVLIINNFLQLSQIDNRWQ